MVYIKTYDEPICDTTEILRYAGVRSVAPDMMDLLESCLAEMQGKLSYKACWQTFPVTAQGNALDLTFTQTTSTSLRKHLQGCDSIVLFAATIGLELDRLIARYGYISPSRALMFQAIGAERIEALCDLVSRDTAERAADCGKRTTSRFSPGYGDLPIGIQADIFRVLDCPRKIGLTLNESLLMSPSKSVTALIGIGGEGCQTVSGCESCSHQNCTFRGMK